MNILANTLKRVYDITDVEVKELHDVFDAEVSQHLYWQIGGFQVDGQSLITSWVVIAILSGSAATAVRNPRTIPTGDQNFKCTRGELWATVRSIFLFSFFLREPFVFSINSITLPIQ